MFFEILQTPGNRSLKRKRRTREMTILRLRFRLQYRPFLDPLVQSAQLLKAQAKDARELILRLRVRLRSVVRQFLPVALLRNVLPVAERQGYLEARADSLCQHPREKREYVL